MTLTDITREPETRKTIVDYGKMLKILGHIETSGEVHAIDIETAGEGRDTLNPRSATGALALIQIHGPTGTFIFDMLGLGATPVRLVLEAAQAIQWAVFNAKFEMDWFTHLRPGTYTLLDTANMYRVLEGGNSRSLEWHVREVLGVQMNKDVDHSQWAMRPLTPRQLEYAADDAVQTFDLFTSLAQRMTPALWKAFHLFNNLTAPVLEMQHTGLRLNKQGHAALVVHWEEEAATLHEELRQVVPPADCANLNSGAQLANLMREILPTDFIRRWPRTRKTQAMSMTRNNIEALLPYFTGPLGDFFRTYLRWRKTTKYLQSFGECLIDKADAFGAIHATYNIGRAITGRFSCSEPNLQQIPKSPEVRRSFEARPGKVLVVADYSAIEVRTLAEMSGDEALLYDAIYGDPHARMAASINGRQIEDYDDRHNTPVLDKERSASKPVTFLILYGGQAPGLAGSMGVQMPVAQGYIDTWVGHYPDAYNFRYAGEREVRATGYLTLPTGRKIWMGRKAGLPSISNYPIQGTAGDVLNAAIHRFYTRLCDYRRDHESMRLHARIVAVVHDEIIVECLEKDAPQIKTELEACMVQGWLDIFPGSDTHGLVEAGVGRTWDGAKL